MVKKMMHPSIQMDSARIINQLISFLNALEHDTFQCFQPIKKIYIFKFLHEWKNE
jgi:hypothetical protein